MEFKSLSNIETTFAKVRMYAIIFAVFCFAVVVYTTYSAYSYADAQRQKIYVLDQGKSLMLALAQDAKANRPVEIREHVRRFHELFFTLAPYKDAIESQMSRAFDLCDESAHALYMDYQEKRFYSRLIAGNAHQRIEIDSLVCDFDSYPYKVRTYGKQMIIRPSNITTRSLITDCQLLNAVRSDNNPQGLMMEDFRIVENEEIETIKR